MTEIEINGTTYTLDGPPRIVRQGESYLVNRGGREPLVYVFHGTESTHEMQVVRAKEEPTNG
jgi:hypothetical protein